MLRQGGALGNQLGRGRRSPARRSPSPKRKKKSFPANEAAVLPGCVPALRSAKTSGVLKTLDQDITC